MTRTAEQRKQSQKRFLAAYRKMGGETIAAKAAKVDRHTVWTWKKNDQAFLEEFEKAKAEAIEDLEKEAVRRAKKGSDVLLIFLLKAARPDVYRERQSIEHSGQTALSVTNEVRITRVEMLNDQEYLEFQRQRAIAADANACLVRANGEQKPLGNGQASGTTRPGTNGHSGGAQRSADGV